jgi:hypothetical protein
MSGSNSAQEQHILLQPAIMALLIPENTVTT